MSVLSSAIGAILAAIIEVAVLGHLQVESVRPDLVFSIGMAVALVLGFECGMTWAFVGGLTLDILIPERALGSAAFALVVTIGLALLITRATWPPRTIVILALTYPLAILYQALLLLTLSLTSGVSVSEVALPDLGVAALLDVVVTAIAVWVVRALDLRFGEAEHAAW
jgi:rod shape-determining protein MreD